MQKNHEEWMRQAIDLALHNVRSGAGGPFGALVVKDDRLIASGVNSVTSMNDPTAHAEIVAMRAACQILQDFQLTGCLLYTTCEPCPMCLGAIYWAGLTAYYFSCTRQSAAEAGFDDAFIYDQLNVAAGATLDSRVLHFAGKRDGAVYRMGEERSKSSLLRKTVSLCSATQECSHAQGRCGRWLFRARGPSASRHRTFSGRPW